VRVYTHTLRAERGKLARLSVEVDLLKPLVPKVFLGNHWQKVEYEGIHLICFTCGKFGHRTEYCEHNPNAVKVQQPEKSTDETPHLGAEKSYYGPWMTVQRRGRRPNSVANPSTKKGKSSMAGPSRVSPNSEVMVKDNPSGSRFDQLQNMETEEGEVNEEECEVIVEKQAPSTECTPTRQVLASALSRLNHEVNLRPNCGNSKTANPKSSTVSVKIPSSKNPSYSSFVLVRAPFVGSFTTAVSPPSSQASSQPTKEVSYPSSDGQPSLSPTLSTTPPDLNLSSHPIHEPPHH